MKAKILITKTFKTKGVYDEIVELKEGTTWKCRFTDQGIRILIDDCYTLPFYTSNIREYAKVIG